MSLSRVLARCLVALAFATTAAHATDTIDVQANATFEDYPGHPVTVLSNKVSATLVYAPPTINFYTDATYQRIAPASELGAVLFVGVTANGCNRDAAVAEAVVVDLWSAKLQQKLSYTASETGNNTGLFRFQLATGSTTVTQGGGVHRLAVQPPPQLATSTNDVVHATVEDCGNGAGDASAIILIDPSGVVFDSATNAPLAGAVVTLIDVDGAGNGGNAGGPARVFGFDGVTPAASTVTTGNDGVYLFPMVAISRYRLDIVPPANYSYPSTVAWTAMPKTRYVDVNGSYHKPFAIDLSVGLMLVDVPLDEAPHGLSVTKSVSRATAEVTESVGYTVIVRNVGTTDLQQVSLQDKLPTGFAYVHGTTTLDGKSTFDPTGGRGPGLSFPLPPMPTGASHTLTYRAAIGALALEGDGINRAQAHATAPFATTSNLATAAVQVQQGVFTDRAMVLGKVFADCNGNGVQDAGEPGIPGVRLFMEDGSFIETDGNGSYSFYGIAPRTHVLKIDATTLPAGMTPEATSSRNAGDGASRFVDPRAGELHRADFALTGCGKDLAAVVAQRNQTASEIDSALKLDFHADGTPQATGDVRAQPAMGVVGETPGVMAPNDGSTHAAAPGLAASSAHATPASAAASEPSLAQRLEGADTSLAFLDLKDGQVLASSQPTLRVKGPSTLKLALAIDGQPVGETRVGTRLQDDARGLQARDYIGVPLTAGEHVLVLTGADQFGNVRGTVRVTVRAPGDLGRIKVIVPTLAVEADGKTEVTVAVDLLDAHGVPVDARLPVTLDATLGEWDVVDLDPKEPGVQTFVEGGHAEFKLRAPRTPGAAEVRIASGSVTAKATLTFSPALRPLVAAGIIEGALDLHHLRGGSIVPAGNGDGFEEMLTNYAGNGNTTGDGRAALFLKGKVLGSSLLTVGYDSAKDNSQGLFRDIQPDQFYPVYGDSSVRGFDAQSTSHLYVKIENGKSWALYGDFTTQSDDPARQLGTYQRSLTGAKGHMEEGALTANVFAARATSTQVVDEMPANGTSGPFLLSAKPEANSETVMIVVRDRNQPSLVIKTTTLTRFTDYDIDDLTGRLLLHAPVATFDPDLDPQFVRVTYEAATGGPSYTVAGADAKVKVGEHLEVGGSVVTDQNPLDTMHMGSANVTYKPDDKTSVTVEGARTSHELEGTGNAERVEIKHDGDKLKVQALAAHTDATFENASSLIGKGRTEGEVKASYALDDKTRLVVEGAHSADVVSGDKRDGVLAGVERSIDGGAKLEVGARLVHDVAGTDAVAEDSAGGNTATVRAKYTTPVPGVPKATAFVEGEQAVNDSDKHLVAVGGDYHLTPTSRVYARQEIISSLTGPLSLDAGERRNATLLGIDTDGPSDSHVFSEYRVADGIDGRDAEAAMGLRKLWQIMQGLRLNTTFERVRSLSGTTDDNSIAVTAAVEWTGDPLAKASGRIELRDSTSSRSALSTLGYARKLTTDWTLLARNAFALTESKIGGVSPMQERFQIGAAYRDTIHNLVNALARYEWRREDDGTDFEHRNVHILSAHADRLFDRTTTLTGEYAIKHALEQVNGQWIAGNAQLATARLTHDLGERWDIGVALRLLADGDFSNRMMGVGAELGYRAIENLWVSVGYNVIGFRERDLADDGTTQLGAYMRLRFKFDETLFGAKADGAAAAKVSP